MAELIAAGDRPGAYRLCGSVSFSNVHTLSTKTPQPAPDGSCLIDLSELEEADSSVLGLLVGWLRKLRAGGYDLKVLGLSASLKSLIHLYNLEPLLISGSR